MHEESDDQPRPVRTTLEDPLDLELYDGGTAAFVAQGAFGMGLVILRKTGSSYSPDAQAHYWSRADQVHRYKTWRFNLNDHLAGGWPPPPMSPWLETLQREPLRISLYAALATIDEWAAQDGARAQLVVEPARFEDAMTRAHMVNAAFADGILRKLLWPDLQDLARAVCQVAGRVEEVKEYCRG